MGTGPGELLQVTTVSPVYGGYALARAEGVGVLFVRGSLPGEGVRVRVGERKRDYAFADAVEVLSPSPHRVEPPCGVFGTCGGCQIQHASYTYQLEMKRDILRDASTTRFRPSSLAPKSLARITRTYARPSGRRTTAASCWTEEIDPVLCPTTPPDCG